MKLSQKELKRTKTDFDAPRVAPGQTSLFEEPGEGKRAGRGRLHTEPGRTFSVWLEDDLIHRLKRAALDHDMSASSFARSAIIAALK